MVVYAKLLYNGAKGAVLENLTLKLENFNDFNSFFWFWPKKFPGGCQSPRGGPVIKNFPRQSPLHPPPPPTDPPVGGGAGAN